MDKIEALIINLLKELGSENDNENLINANSKTKLLERMVILTVWG